MRFKVEVSSFCTRLIIRDLTINAVNKEEAECKAIEKYIKLETNVASSIDFEDPRINFTKEL